MHLPLEHFNLSQRSLAMDKIIVKWTEGRSKGTTSVVKRSAVKSGAIVVGNNMSVVWGKSRRRITPKVWMTEAQLKSSVQPLLAKTISALWRLLTSLPLIAKDLFHAQKDSLLW